MDLGQASFALKNGRQIHPESPEFAEKLPITKGVLDRLSKSDDVLNAIGALVTAVALLEARGVEFEDEEPA